MSDTTNYSNNIYHADYLVNSHPRKGKKMDKHQKVNGVKKILQYKAKNNLGRETWVSSWDVYKASANKKRSHSQAKLVRAKGFDYKFFTQTNEIPNDNTNQDQVQEFLDCYNDWTEYDDCLDYYYDCSDRSYSDCWDDDWDRWI